MNDEEKKAIEWLKLLVKTHKLKTQEVTKDEVLLNLIEKQAKEIKDNYFLYIKEKNNYDKLLVLYEKQQKEIKKFKKVKNSRKSKRIKN